MRQRLQRLELSYITFEKLNEEKKRKRKNKIPQNYSSVEVEKVFFNSKKLIVAEIHLSNK